MKCYFFNVNFKRKNPMVTCSQTIHFVLAHRLEHCFQSPSTYLHAMIALKKTFFQMLKTALVYIFAFTNYGDKVNLGLSEADSY